MERAHASRGVNPLANGRTTSGTGSAACREVTTFEKRLPRGARLVSWEVLLSARLNDPRAPCEPAARADSGEMGVAHPHGPAIGEF